MLTIEKLKEFGADTEDGLRRCINMEVKGVYSNLSLTPLVDPIVKMTELLRAGTQTDHSPLMGEAKGAFERLKALSE